MTLRWNDNLLTGDEEIDTHHKAFFIKARELVQACERGRGAAELREMIRFLASYVQHHFRAEDARMEAIDYPDIEVHQAEHQAFIDRLEALSYRFLSEGASPELGKEVQTATVEWLENHILETDMPLMERLKKVWKR